MYSSIDSFITAKIILKLEGLPSYGKLKHLIPTEPDKTTMIINCDTPFINLFRQTLIGKLKKKTLYFDREDYKTNNHLQLPYMGVLTQFSQIHFDQTKDIKTSFYSENLTDEFQEYTLENMNLKLEDYGISKLYTLGHLSPGDYINIRKIYTKEDDAFMLVESWEYEDIKYDGDGSKKAYINECIKHKFSFSSLFNVDLLINKTVDYIVNTFKEFKNSVINTPLKKEETQKFKFNGDEGGYGYLMEMYADKKNIRLKSSRFFYEVDVYSEIEIRSKDMLLKIIDGCIDDFEKFRKDVMKKIKK